jgi:hypothetical protein
MLDLNDAAPQMGPMGELIPDGSFCKLKMIIRKGGVNGSGPIDVGLLTASKTSDAKFLDCEFIVMEGPFARRKFWRNFVVDGGKRNKEGASTGWGISKSTFRAMLESAQGVDPKDMGEDAKRKRTLQGLAYLDGIVFAARVMIEPASDPQYKDKNDLANVVLPNELQYAFIMNGQPVDPEPVNAKPRKSSGQAAAGGAQQAPSWQQGQGQQQPTAAQQQQGGGSGVPAWAKEG